MRKRYLSKKSFTYEIYASISKATDNKVFQERDTSSIREFSLLHNLQFLHGNCDLSLGASSIRDAPLILVYYGNVVTRI